MRHAVIVRSVGGLRNICTTRHLQAEDDWKSGKTRGRNDPEAEHYILGRSCALRCH